MKPSDVVGTNRTVWEEAAPRFKDRKFAYLLKHFREPGFCCLMLEGQESIIARVSTPGGGPLWQ